MIVTTVAPTDDTIVEQKRVDARPRWRRMIGPMSAAAVVLAASALVYAVDPGMPGRYPVCPTQYLFGVDCPACGMLRGTHDLLHLNLAGAADHNVLMFALYPLVVVMWVLWVRQAWRGYRPPLTRGQARRRDRILLAVLVAVLVFGVVRWFVPYLGSGLSGG